MGLLFLVLSVSFPVGEVNLEQNAATAFTMRGRVVEDTQLLSCPQNCGMLSNLGNFFTASPTADWL